MTRLLLKKDLRKRGVSIPLNGGMRFEGESWLVPDEVSLEVAQALAAQHPEQFQIVEDKPTIKPKKDEVDNG